MDYKKTKLLFAFTVFIISLTVYLFTLEPTNSFWDCSEFITCAYGLEVGHAPGAPVFMLVGHLFGLMAPSPEKVALYINALSALASALTVMILFCTISWFAEQINKSTIHKYRVIASAFIGALTYAFTDSFWFSAVEAEVYATSSLFTALVFWAILKYASSESVLQSYRWIILIFFILGLSVGIHLLNLLTLPALALVIYFKRYKFKVKGLLVTVSISGFILVTFINGIIPGIVKLAAFFDRIFVNQIHLPRYSGAMFFIIGLSIILLMVYQYYSKKHKIIAQLAILAFSFWLIGYSSFTVLVIRSSQNPFVDINNVENIYGLVDYLNREQYPARPLLYGNNYNSPIVDVNKRYTYKYHIGKYIKDELNPHYKYDKNTLTLFPRMASMDKNHQKAYKHWVNIKGRKVKVQNSKGEMQTIMVPTIKENLQFFFRYQLGYMYARYFMWNFVGKQNDIQGRGDAIHGNWLSGICFIDNARLGNQNLLTDFYKNHKARNTYYFSPFILGILGMWFQYKKDKNNFWINFVLFFFTGFAIVFYLNEIPITPRERDYVHVGSFYVFALWIGIGSFALINLLDSSKTLSRLSFIIPVVLFLLVPLNMFIQNYDDHNRSNRYTANAYGKNMLDSCEENAILVTTADNDTYPLWYLQEVEKYRPDVRNVLLTFLPVDWYANQLQIKHSQKGKIPISFNEEELFMNKNQYFPVVNRIDTFLDVEKVVSFVRNSSEKTKVRISDNSLVNYIPGNKMALKVNAANFIKSCNYIGLLKEQIPETIKININKTYLQRSDLLLLDMLANNNWERPVYFVYPHLLNNLGLSEYLHREGMVYRLMPFTQKQMVNFAKERSLHEYKLLMHNFGWGNVNDESVYLDHTNVQTVGSFRLRQMFIETANLLSFAHEKQKAKEVLNKAQQLFPPERIPYSWFMPEMVKSYKLADSEEKAKELLNKIESDMMNRYKLNEHLKQNGHHTSRSQETHYIMQQLAELRNE